MTEIDSEYWKKEYQRDLDLKAKQICEDGAKIERLEDENKRLREALIWCGGSPDFCPGGQARIGWEKLVIPLLSPKPRNRKHD